MRFETEKEANAFLMGLTEAAQLLEMEMYQRAAELIRLRAKIYRMSELKPVKTVLTTQVPVEPLRAPRMEPEWFTQSDRDALLKACGGSQNLNTRALAILTSRCPTKADLQSRKFLFGVGSGTKKALTEFIGRYDAKAS